MSFLKNIFRQNRVFVINRKVFELMILLADSFFSCYFALKDNALQIYGTRKCTLTRKAERFFRERGISYHFVDLEKYPPSKGELENIRRRIPAGETLVNTESPAYVKRGLAYMDYDEIEEILACPLLMRTPLVREGSRVIVGDDAAAWGALAEEMKS